MKGRNWLWNPATGRFEERESITPRDATKIEQTTKFSVVVEEFREEEGVEWRGARKH